MSKNQSKIAFCIFFTSTFLCNVNLSLAQLKFEYIQDITVTEDGIELANPFAGGLNSGQYNTLDINGDGDLDLVVFDRSSDKINTFINTGNSYDYRPLYEYYFPTDIINWVVFADYDCDGKKDLFTYTGFGIRVFRNTSSNGLPSWELAVDLLLTLGTSSKINLFLNSTDIPGIADMDGDGDLDIMAFNFSTGAVIEYHQNFSIERTGDCGSLDFERISRKYGDIEECVCNVFTFNNTPCPDGGRQLHSGGKTTTLYDFDADGDMDIIVGQEICNDIYLIENKGSRSASFYDSFTNLFPENGVSVSLFTFPTTFVEDVNFDGLEDIIIAPNIRSNVGNAVDFKYSSRLYENIGTSTAPNFSLTKTNFLQGEMIDVGEDAYPAFTDYDGDGDDDLFIGNRGSRNQFGYYSSLALYRNDTDQFTLIDEDYNFLSLFDMEDIRPNFIDINGDGKTDIYFTGRTFGNFRLHYILNTSVNDFLFFDLTQLVTLPALLGGSDDPVLSDTDLDGDLDLLVARSTGRLTYFNNTGTSINPVFELESDTLMGLNFNSAHSNLSIAIDDINSDNLMDLVTSDRSGELRIYLDYFKNQSQTPQSELLSLDGSADLVATQMGRISRLAIGTFNTQKVISIGSIQGGIRLLGTEIGASGNVGELDVKVFPVPSKLNKNIWVQTANLDVFFEIYSISGLQIISRTRLDQFQRQGINLSNLKPGIYLVRFQNQSQSKTLKFTLGDG